MAVFSKPIQLIVGYSAALITAKLLVLSTNVVLALSLTDLDFGYISLSLSLFIAAVGVFGFNAQAAFTRYTHEYGAGAVLIALVPGYLVMIGLATASGLLTLAILGLDSSFSWFALLPISGLAASHLASASATARATNNLKAYASGEITRPAILLFLILVYLQFTSSFSVGPFFIFALLISSVLGAALSWRLQKSAAKSQIRPISSKKVISYVAPLFVMQMVALANGISDRFFLAAWFSLEEVGVYSKAYLIGSVLGMAFDSLSLLWAPYVVKQRSYYFVELHSWVQKIYVSSWIVAACLVVLAWVAPRILSYEIFFFNTELVRLSLVIAAAFVMRTGYQVCVPVLNAFDMTPAVARLSIISAVIGLLANVILIFFFGGLGAGLATLLAFTVFSAGAYKRVTLLNPRGKNL